MRAISVSSEVCLVIIAILRDRVAAATNADRFSAELARSLFMKVVGDAIQRSHDAAWKRCHFANRPHFFPEWLLVQCGFKVSHCCEHIADTGLEHIADKNVDQV